MGTSREMQSQNQVLKDQLDQKTYEMKVYVEETTKERENLRYELQEQFQASKEKLQFLLNSCQLEFFRYISSLHDNNTQRLEYDVDELVNYAASILSQNMNMKRPGKLQIQPISNFISPDRESPTVKLNFDFLNASPITLDGSAALGQDLADKKLVEQISKNYNADQAYQMLYALADNILIAKKIMSLTGGKVEEERLKNAVNEIEASVVEYNKNIRGFYKQHKTIKTKTECVETLEFFSSLLGFFTKSKDELRATSLQAIKLVQTNQA